MNSSIARMLYGNPRLWILCVSVILVAGFCALLIIPRLEDPETNIRTAYVLTEVAGAKADRVETQVTERIENALREEKYVRNLISESRDSFSFIIVELAHDATDLEPIWTGIQNKLVEVEPELPRDAEAPKLVKTEWDSYSILIALSLPESADPDYASLTRHARELQQRLQYVKGTKHTRSFGVQEEEMLVELDPFQLAAINLSVAKIGDRILAADAKTGGGLKLGASDQVLLEIAGGIDNISRIAEIPIQISEQGSTLYLGEIADIKKTTRSPKATMVTVDGRPSVVVAARAFSDIQIDEWTSRVEGVLEEFQETLPRDLEVSIIFQQSIYTYQRWNSLLTSLLLGLVSVGIFVWLLMGVRATIPIMIALPLAIATTVVLMGLTGVSLHQISFIGVVIALGLLIDNPIIVVDELQNQTTEATEAIPNATRRLFGPLTGAALTTVLAFAPLLLINGPTGEYLWTLGASVIYTVLASLAIALWMIPAIAAWSGNIGQSSAGVMMPPLAWLVKSTVSVFLRIPVIGILVPSLLAVFGFYWGQFIPEQFFPPSERNQVRLQLRLPPSSTIEQTAENTRQVSEVLSRLPQLKRISWFVGAKAPPFYYNLFGGEEGSPFLAEALVELHDNRDVASFINTAQRLLSKEVPSSQAILRELEQGPPALAPLEIRVYGEELSTLVQLGESFRQIMTEIPSVTNTRMTMEFGQPVMQLVVDEDTSLRLDLLSREIAEQLAVATTGTTNGILLESTEALPIRVKLKEEFRRNWYNIFSIPIKRTQIQAAQPTLIRAIATPKLIPEFATISHRNGRRCNTIRGFLAADVLPSLVLNDLQNALEKHRIELPTGYQMEIGGDDELRNEAVDQLMAYVPILVVLMAAVIVWAISSFRLAMVVGVVALLSIGYSIAALYVSGFPFGIMSVIGMMGMMGIAVNDSVVVVAALHDHFLRRAVTRMEVIEVVGVSSRHVLATTFTTVAGFMPLFLSNSDFWGPLAIVVIGGVLSATVLSLILVPSAFLLLSRRAD